MRDYSKRSAGVSGGRQRVAGKRSRGGDGRQVVFKFIGMVSLAALLVGVVSSLWFGMALRDGLASLDRGKEERVALAASNAALTEQREALLQQEKVQLAAGALGLYSPSDKQLRRP